MDFMSNMFPRGLRVLVVDESFICLKSIETLLKECGYQVTTATSAEFALDLLRKNKENFDIVITNIETGEMNGFRLSEIICLEIDIPVLMMCQGNDRETLMKCLEHGACGCLMKPPTLKEIEDIWHYVFKHKKNKSTLSDLDIQKNETERNLNMNEEASGQRTRVSWADPELHAKFVEACHKLGDEAVPSRIVLEMNVPGLTREQVAITAATSAEFALDVLRKNKKNFDIVITDTETGEMNGFRLLEIICLEMDIPVLSKYKFCLTL
ncbi:hypothetical protein MKW92_022794 [Papaver armeniacum]|nr:hypothetical protein MKW92_022794 [Papaver armeniacum]